MNYSEFISARKSLLIAPAGYGKTYTLAECIKYTPDSQKQLILTHTNAGIDSIKVKIRSFNIDSSKYSINTITGFAQKYVLSLCNSADLPPQDEDACYFNAVINKAVELFKLESVKRIIKCSYDGLFVDEYQDCNKSQHNIIKSLAEVLPTHLLGDPMQGIFDFNGTLVDFKTDLDDFDYRSSLEIPWRWQKDGNNKDLGDLLKKIRTILESDDKEKRIDLTKCVAKDVYFYKVNEQDIYNLDSDYSKFLRKLITNPNQKTELNSLLVLLPDDFQSDNLNIRASLKSRIDYTNQLTLLEAIDDKDYYHISSSIDQVIATMGSDNFNLESKESKKHIIRTLKEEVLLKLFNKKAVDAWIGDGRLINKREPYKENGSLLENRVNNLFLLPSLQNIYSLILFLKNDLKFKTKRRELLYTVLKAIHSAATEETSVYEAMRQYKNRLRCVGRKIYGKCLGTTLLTKGLEFDTVVVLDAHKFKSYKHFYVAVTRACKKLVIFSKEDVVRLS